MINTRTPLEQGSVILNTPSRRIVADRVKALGGSAIVYEGYEIDRLTGKRSYKLIKELFPNQEGFYRDKNGKISCDKSIERECNFFNRMLLLEKDEVNKYNKLSVDEKGIRNDYFFADSEFIEADNGNFYILLDTVKGYTLKEIIDLSENGGSNILCYRSLSEICSYIIALLNAVQYCHGEKNKLLHLDIAPDNIFISETVGTNEFKTRLIDFNSSVLIDGTNHVNLSFKSGYSAPELINAMYSKNSSELGCSTDLYSVAAVMYRMVFKKCYSSDDIFDFDSFFNELCGSNIVIVENSEYLDEISQNATAELHRILEKGLKQDPKKRYLSAEEFRGDICNLKKMTEESVWLISSANIHIPDYCVSREETLDLIDRKLAEFGYLFISGIDGSGKSSIAAMYALSEEYGSKYKTICFSQYTTNLKELVIRLKFHGINEKDYLRDNSDTDSLDTNLIYAEKLKALSQEKNDTLLVITNYNAACDEFFSEFISHMNCRVIFTTRTTCEDCHHLSLGSIAEDKAVGFFAEICPERMCNEEKIYQIVKLTGCHFLSMKMIALLLHKYTRVTCDEVLEKIEDGSAFERGNISVDFNSGFGTKALKKGTPEEILTGIFNLSSLSEQMIFILSAMTVIPLNGINKDDFMNALDLDKFDDTVYDLIELGWIAERGNYIYLHPVISDFLYRNKLTAPNFDKLAVLLSSPELSNIINIGGRRGEFETCKSNALFLKKRVNGHTMECGLLLYKAGLCLTDCGAFSSAAEAMHSALSIVEDVCESDGYLSSSICADLCHNYVDANDPKNAILFGKKALNAFGNVLNNDSAVIHNNMGLAYIELHNYDEALNHFEIAEKACELKKTRCTIYASMGTLYMQKGEYRIAEEYLLKALDTLDEKNNANLYNAFIFNNLGILCLGEKNMAMPRTI